MKPSKNGVKIGKDWRAYRRTQDGLHTYTSVVYKTGQMEDGRDLISIQANHHWPTKHSEIVGPSLDCSDDKRYSMILSLGETFSELRQHNWFLGSRSPVEFANQIPQPDLASCRKTGLSDK